MSGFRATELGLILLFFFTLSGAQNQSDSSAASGAIDNVQLATVTFTNVTSSETLLSVLDEPWKLRVVIRNSYFSHLPFLETPMTITPRSMLLDSTFVAFLAPQTDDVQNQQPFLKALNISLLEITNCSSVHAYDWENADPYTLIVNNSQFVSIPKSFKKMTKLTQFMVINSGLRWVPKDTFKGMTKLTSIQLSDNQIESFEAGTFSSLTSLINLNLGGNRIMSMAPGVLPSHVSLLTLEKNPLQSLDFKAFDGIEIDTLVLCESTLNCTCDGLAKVHAVTGTCAEGTTVQPWLKKIFQCQNPNQPYSGGEINDGCR